MYAIRVVGPSGFVQYVAATNVPFLTQSSNFAMMFETEEEANIVAYDIPFSALYGRVVDVVDFEGE